MSNVTIPERSGLALPAVRLNGGYFAPRSTYDVAWGDLIIAAFVPQGTRPWQRSLGGTASDYLLSPLDGIMLAALQDAVAQAVARQCPHIRVLRVDAAKATDPRTVDLSVSFTVTTNPAGEETRLMRLDRRMVGNLLRVARGM